LKDDMSENTCCYLLSTVVEDTYFLTIGMFLFTYGASQKYTISC